MVLLAAPPATRLESTQLAAATSASGQTAGVDIALTPDDGGYWVVDDHGRVFTFGSAAYLGGSPALLQGETVVSLDATPTGLGYRVFTSAGRVFAYGDASHLGDLSGTQLAGAIVDTTSTSTGDGYYMLGNEGGVFAFGDAAFLGSIQQIMNDSYGGIPAVDWLDEPIVSLAVTDANEGYWLVGADGGMFAFGDAGFWGSVPGTLPHGTQLARPIVGAITQGSGYLMVGADGGIFNFGTSPFHGSIPGLALPQAAVQLPSQALITSVAVATGGTGYSMLGSDGAIWPFGSLATELAAFSAVDLSIPADPGDTVDCDDFDTTTAAQLWFDGHSPFHGDVARIDADGDGSPCEAGDEDMPTGPTATVMRIVDGDTVEVLLGGTTTKVRLIGINTPESNECLGSEAGIRLGELILGRKVTLVEDVDAVDQYGRRLYYLFLGSQHVNATLVREGLALAVEYAPNTARSAELAAEQVFAQSVGVGLWASDACGVGSSNTLRIVTVNYNAPGNDNDNLNGEWVVITNDGPATAHLTDWVLRDNSSSHRYNFPTGANISSGASVRIYTGCGTDDFAVALYWCNTRSAVWNNSGDTAFLLDPAGNVHDSYTY